MKRCIVGILPLVFAAGLVLGVSGTALADSVSGAAGTARYYAVNNPGEGDGWPGTLVMGDYRTWVVTLTNIDGSGVTGNGTYQLVVQDHGYGTGYTPMFVTQVHHGFYGAGGHLLQNSENWVVKSSHGFNPGDVSGLFDLRIVMTRIATGVDADKWRIKPYYRLPSGNWTLFYDGAYTGSAGGSAAHITKGRVLVQIDGGGGGTLTFDAPTAFPLSPCTDTYVDDDWAGAPDGAIVYFPGDANPHVIGIDAFDTVQEGVDAACPGGTVHVAPGTFVEQVTVDGKDLRVVGSGRAATFVHSPVSLAVKFVTSGPTNNRPVIAAMNAASVRIEDLTVDGLGRGNANYRFIGIGFWNAGGKVLDCDVTGIQDTPFSGNQHGVGIYAYNSTGGPYALEIGGCVVDEFQKNAMALSGTGLAVDVHGCTVTGKGDTSVTAQNGIQVSYGAGGTVSDCTISGVRYTPASWTASGLLVFYGAPVAASDIIITNSQSPVYWMDNDGSMSGMDVTGGDFDGIFVYNTSTSKASADAGGSRAVVPADPLAEDANSAPSVLSAAGAQSLWTVTIDASCVKGSDVAGTWGIDAYSAGGPLDVTVTNTRVSDYDYGLVAVGSQTVLTANDNSITSNPSAGYDNTYSGNAQDATQNWWGDASGPGGDGAGSGDAVVSVGGEVDFDPWRIDGTSSELCAFTPETNVVDPVPETTCISTVEPCVDVDFVVTRTDNAPMRGFSVTFALSPELMLCNGVVDITEGTYLSAVGGTNMQVLDNGGGSYTVDVAILGLPCGATATPGTLFSIKVKNSGGDGTGSITVTNVIYRDCVNQPIPGTGGSTTITIDNTLPAAIANLAAAQVKTGNDGDGTTGITITYTAPGDAVLVEVYRKGFGFYPEYDDLGGAAPVAPATPAAAVLAGWVLTSVSSTGDVDETDTERDFWYYVAYSYDACGNVSPVSNRTGGTLNYHLGDVVPLVVAPPFGDNLVNIFDISKLGASYGTVHGGPLYDNTLDVGPTTDYYVDARPTTDNRIQFEDLMMFAINYGQVAKPGGAAPAGADRNAVTVSVGGLPGVGGTFAVSLDLASTGEVVGVSVPLRWNPETVDCIGYAAGDLMDRQAGHGVVLSPGPGTVDAAVFGGTIAGEGTLATMTFRVIAIGDPGIGLGEVIARDGMNRPVRLDGSVVGTVSAPVVTRLLQPAPNPFASGTTIGFALKEAGPVVVRIYSADGRLVRTLVNGVEAAGEHAVTWNGRDDQGRETAAGAYLVRLTTPSVSATQRMVRIR